MGGGGALDPSARTGLTPWHGDIRGMVTSGRHAEGGQQTGGGDEQERQMSQDRGRGCRELGDLQRGLCCCHAHRGHANPHSPV